MSYHKVFTSNSSYFIPRAATDFNSVQAAVYSCSSLETTYYVLKRFLFFLICECKTLRFMLKIVEVIVNMHKHENSLVGFKWGIQLYEKLLKHELIEVSGAYILCILDSKDDTWYLDDNFCKHCSLVEVVTLNVSGAIVLHVISDEDPAVTNRKINQQTTLGRVCFKVSYPGHIL